MRSGHQCPVRPVITIAAAYTAATYGAHTATAPSQRAKSTVERPTGRTINGWSSPRSASPRTTPSVRNTASTTPRKSVANIARPNMNAPAKARASMPAGGEMFSTSRKT